MFAMLLGNHYIEIFPPKFPYQNTWVTPHLPTLGLNEAHGLPLLWQPLPTPMDHYTLNLTPLCREQGEKDPSIKLQSRGNTNSIKSTASGAGQQNQIPKSKIQKNKMAGIHYVNMCESSLFICSEVGHTNPTPCNIYRIEDASIFCLKVLRSSHGCVAGGLSINLFWNVLDLKIFNSKPLGF